MAVVVDRIRQLGLKVVLHNSWLKIGPPSCRFQVGADKLEGSEDLLPEALYGGREIHVPLRGTGIGWLPQGAPLSTPWS